MKKAHHIGAILRELREYRHLTKADLARKSGLSPSYIRWLEKDQRQPTVGTIYALARALGVSDDVFLKSNAEAEPENKSIIF